MYAELRTAIPGVSCLWVHRVEGPTRVLPDACADLIWQAGRGAFVAGPDSTAALIDIAPGTVLIGARFAPGAGGPALGTSLQGLRDTRVDAAAYRLDPGWSPRDAWWGVARAAERLAVAPDLAVMEAARRLADPRQRVATLAADLGFSERQLRRRCLAAAGHAPKALQRILRFRAFVAAAERAPGAELAFLAADAGYADQAHLTHEVRDLSGLTPATLVSSRVG